MSESLSVEELFEGVNEYLVDNNCSEKITFSENIIVEVADDSDWHRTRKGYMIYEDTNLCMFGEKKYLIALALSTEGYPANKYSCDLTAVELSEDDTSKELEEELKESTYFKNSLILAVENGGLGAVRNKYGDRIISFLENKSNDLIAQEPEYNKKYITMTTLGPLCTERTKYKKEAVNEVGRELEKILQDSS